MRTLFDRVLYLAIKSVKVLWLLTSRYSLRIATSVRQSVGTHLVGSCFVDRLCVVVVVVVVLVLKFKKFDCPRKMCGRASAKVRLIRQVSDYHFG
jgi:hypothetical protein